MTDLSLQSAQAHTASALWILHGEMFTWVLGFKIGIGGVYDPHPSYAGGRRILLLDQQYNRALFVSTSGSLSVF